MGGFQNPIVGGTALRIPAIQSPNFSPGADGWIIRIDGSAEFNNLTIRGTFNGNDFILNSSGLFIYDGTPAAGNLVATIAPAQGTDGFGNTYLGGIATYDGDQFVALAVGNILFGLISQGTNTAGLIGLVGADAIEALSPFSVSKPDRATWELVDGAVTVTPQSDPGYPHMDIGANTAGMAAWLHGALLYATASGGTSTAETWHAPSPLGTGWVAGPSGGTVQPVQYRRDALDNLVIVGTAHTTSTTPASTVFTLPAGYRPKITQRCVGVSNSGGTPTVRYIEIQSTGAVVVNPALTTTSTDVYFAATVPLGNVG
jgi:hypothetical protein